MTKSNTGVDYPGGVIELPSKGLLYPEDHPLANGTIEIKYMTAREEDILTSTNLIKKGVVLTKLLESVILTDVDLNDILIGDKTAIYVATRVMGYGPEYKSTIQCPNCSKENQVEIDLGTVEPKEFTLDADHINSFEFTLPSDNTTVLTYHYMTHKDEQNVKTALEAHEKLSKGRGINTELSTQYRYMITAVNGDSNPSHIKEFVLDKFRTRDSKAFVEHVRSTQPDMDLSFDFNCQYCEYADGMEIPIGIGFFWPAD